MGPRDETSHPGLETGLAYYPQYQKSRKSTPNPQVTPYGVGLAVRPWRNGVLWCWGPLGRTRPNSTFGGTTLDCSFLPAPSNSRLSLDSSAYSWSPRCTPFAMPLQTILTRTRFSAAQVTFESLLESFEAIRCVPRSQQSFTSAEYSA